MDDTRTSLAVELEEIQDRIDRLEGKSIFTPEMAERLRRAEQALLDAQAASLRTQVVLDRLKETMDRERVSDIGNG